MELVENSMTTSNEMGELFTALSKVQGSMRPAKKEVNNPFFKMNYADLKSCWETAREPLKENGLALIQIPGDCSGTVELISILGHSSGQWVRSDLKMTPTKTDPQGTGSCLTYARRYAMMALIGIASEDDDGNAASQPRQKQVTKKTQTKAPKKTDEKFDPTQMIEAFKELGVSVKDMEAKVQTSVSDFTAKERKVLAEWYTELYARSKQ